MGSSLTRQWSNRSRGTRQERIASWCANAMVPAIICMCMLILLPSATASAQIIDTSKRPFLLIQDSADEFDCEDFDYQEDAQEVLNADTSDPNALDPNLDGIACALLPSRDAPEENGVEAAQEADANTDRAARQAERAERRNARAQQQEEGDDGSGVVVSVTCANFLTQDEAQAIFDTDTAGYADLDPDGNGIACEELIVAAVDAADSGETETREERRNRRNQNQAENQQDDVAIDQPVQSALREDLDCIDFQYQEEAQSMLERDLSDPFNLDPNGDGFACSSLPSATPVIVQVPRTGAGNAAAWPMLEFGSLAIFAGMAVIASALMRYPRPGEES